MQEEYARLFESLTQPSPTQLVEQAISVWRNDEIYRKLTRDIPAPPDELFDVLLTARKEGFPNFIPFYFPDIKLGAFMKFPGKGIKPSEWFWKEVFLKHLSSRSTKLLGMWVLFDSTKRPDYEGRGKQMYPDDRLAAILKSLRESGKTTPTEHNLRKIPGLDEIPLESRFGLSIHDIYQNVTAEVANVLNIEVEQITIPTLLQFNIVGNLLLPHLAEANTYEWFADEYRYPGFHLIGGRSISGGLADINYIGSEHQSVTIGFRLMIAFPRKVDHLAAA